MLYFQFCFPFSHMSLSPAVTRSMYLESCSLSECQFMWTHCVVSIDYNSACLCSCPVFELSLLTLHLMTVHSAQNGPNGRSIRGVSKSVSHSPGMVAMFLLHGLQGRSGAKNQHPATLLPPADIAKMVRGICLHSFIPVAVRAALHSSFVIVSHHLHISKDTTALCLAS